MSDVVLQARDLCIEYPLADKTIVAVDGVSLDVSSGQRIGIVGESGSGKSTLGLAMIGLLEAPGRIARGELRVDGVDITSADSAQLRALRQHSVGMVFQDALGCLNPVLTIGRQLRECFRGHEDISRSTATGQAEAILAEVGIPNPAARMRQYPHELSGGMRQRVMIAMALAGNPRILIADEPTTALDVTTQALVVELLAELSDVRKMAVLLITHDLGVVAGFAHEVLVMYGGTPMEFGSVDDVYRGGRHPYTDRLLASIPRLDAARSSRLTTIPGALLGEADGTGCAFEPRCFVGHGRQLCQAERPAFELAPAGSGISCHFTDEVEAQSTASLEPGRRPGDFGEASPQREAPVLELSGLKKAFRLGSRTRGGVRLLRAVEQVDLSIRAGESLGLVGESGSGKSTVARILVGLTDADGGTATFEARPLSVRGRRARGQIGRIQMVFQDPGDSLDPLQTVSEIVAEPLRIQGASAGVRERVLELMELVGLTVDQAQRRPVALSGGQRQRVAIARALATNPAILVCDEAVSSLDASIRAQILNLLLDLRESLGLSYLFISHDLSVVRHVCDRVAVMYAGHIVEIADADDLFSKPHHPYTVALLSAVPVPDPVVERSRVRMLLAGDTPDLTKPLEGCPFASRCWKAEAVCTALSPELVRVEPTHWFACHFPENVAADAAAVGRGGAT